MTRDLLLVFAYHFPPENSIGGARPYRFYKYLSRLGVRCRVFTAVDVSSRPDLDAETVVDPFVARPRQGLGWQAERAFRRFFIPGSSGSQWAFLASKAAARFLATEYPAGPPPDLHITLLSTYPPLGTPLAAYMMKRKSHFPWIADFRDPMAGNPSSGDINGFHMLVYRQAERLFINSADLIIANTDVSQQKLFADHPARAHLIHLLWNGFDPENRIAALPLPRRSRRLYSHVGELYEGRSIAPLLYSIGRLIENGKLDPARIQIQQVGPVRAGCLPDASFNAKAESQGWLKVVPQQVPQSEAYKIIQESDGLLLVQPHSIVQVPGKLYDYIQIGRPILAFILPGSPGERILSQSGVPFVPAYASSMTETIDEAVDRYFRLDSQATPPSAWFENCFNGQKHAAQLYHWIQSLHQNGTAAQ